MITHLPFLYSLILWVAIGLLAWFAWDMRSILKAGQRKTQLSIDGNWKDLDNLFKRAERSRRPFVWLHRKYLLPGNLETQYALFLHKQGNLEEALSKVDHAIWQNKNKPWIFQSIHRNATFNTLCGSFRTRTLILCSLGRYDEARQAAAELQKLTGPGSKSNAALALVEYYCGHLDEALALAQGVPARDSQYDSMRTITAFVYGMKGDFQQGVQTLSFEPADATKFYSDSGLKIMTESTERSKLLALQHRKVAGVFKPARLIALAQVYLATDDFKNADQALDQAEKSLGPEPGLKLSYCRQRACSLAGQGKAKEVDNYIERLRAIVKERPKRSLLWEAHFSTGRAYLYLRRYNDALAELTEAQRHVLHPIEKHTTAYWIARTLEAAGNQSEANSYYQIVTADTIPTWMREQAAAALIRLPA